MTAKKIRRILAPALVVAAALAAWLVFGTGDGPEGTLEASGTVEATEGRLGFQLPGRVDAVAVREGDRVDAGAELAVLDRSETLARKAAAEAEIEVARSGLRELEEGFRPEEIAQARAAAAAARERLEDARRDLERTRRLHEGGAASEEAYDKARTAATVARSGYEQAAEKLGLLESGPRQERVEARRARLAAARARLRQVEATLDQMRIVAPFAGVVTVRHREPGEIVAPGGPVVTLMDPADRWVRIYVREDRIGAVQLGQPATITSDTYPGKEHPGEVRFIASEAEFTPKNVQTKEERVKLVYAVEVRITGDDDLELKPGMPADVRLETVSP